MPLQNHHWIETERTGMRPFEEEDAEHAFDWFSDFEVMQFIPGGADVTLEDSRRRILRYREHQTHHGFSKRLILHRETGKAMGDSGLFYLPDGKRIELGFRLAKAYWRQGYARWAAPGSNGLTHTTQRNRCSQMCIPIAYVPGVCWKNLALTAPIRKPSSTCRC